MDFEEQEIAGKAKNWDELDEQCYSSFSYVVHMQVRAEALLDRFHRKGGDGSSEVEGYEGSWRRGIVLKHTNKEKTNTRRWVTVQLHDPKVFLLVML